MSAKTEVKENKVNMEKTELIIKSSVKAGPEMQTGSGVGAHS